MGLDAVVYKNPATVRAEFGIEFEIDEETGESFLEDWEYEQKLNLPYAYSKAISRRLGNWSGISHIRRELGETNLLQKFEMVE